MTVDGSQAKFMKMPERPVDTTTKPTTPPEPITISISDLKVGDAIMAKGTVSGTTIAATEVMTGTFPEKGMGEKGMQGGMHDGMKGDHIHGTVTAVSGTTITVLDSRPKRTEGSTVTETTETTYTVDAASAKVLEMPARPADEATAPSVKPEPTVGTLSDIAVGDTVGIRGTISGTTIVATEIMDGIPPFGHMMPGQNQNQ
jgi:hypothetical protein